LASRLGKLGQPRGTNTGVGSTDEARLATYHRLRKEKGVMRQRKGRRSRSPSLRVSRAGNINGLVARTSLVQLQKSVGDNWSRISSANALQKEWQGRVNGDLARSEGRRVKPSANASSERKSRVGFHSYSKSRNTGTRPRVTRDRYSAVHASPKAVSGSRDRGCNDHRILRRVPADRRHPGPTRSVVFHEKAPAVVLVISASSDPDVSDPTRKKA